MKQTILFILLLSLPFQMFSQWHCYQNAWIDNEVRSTVTCNTGAVSLDLNPTVEQLDARNFAKGLWVGGYDEAGILKIAAETFKNMNSNDYYPGPVDQETYLNIFNHCPDLKFIWTFTDEMIEEHKIKHAWGALDASNLSAELLTYPAKGNKWYEDSLGVQLKDDHAPFRDQNNDGIYNPLEGDYPVALEENPSFLPHKFIYTIYNDMEGVHTETQGHPMGIEVHQTSYLIKEENPSILSQTAFQRLVIINKSPHTFTNFRVGFFVYDNLGMSYYDNFMGCDTINNVVYSYNKNGIDAEDATTGVMLHLFLNKKIDRYMAYLNAGIGDPPPATSDPEIAPQYDYYLNGLWKDGSPMTYGGNGFDPTSTEVVNFAYPSKPSDPNGWSMQSEDFPYSAHRGLPSIKEPDFKPGDRRTIDIADVVWIDNATTGIEKIDEIETVVDEVKDFYNRSFISALTEVSQASLDLHIYPNPATDQITIDGMEAACQLSIWNSKGQLVLNSDKLRTDFSLDIRDFARGIYFVKNVDCQGQVRLGKFVKL